MNPTTPAEGNLTFYVVNNLNHQQMGEKLMIERRLTLPQAIARYNNHRPDQASAIGAMLEGGAHINILRRCAGANALITDYQKLDRWRYNPKLCVSAVNMLIISLGIRQQTDHNDRIRPLEDRLHIMQLKDGDATRDLRWESLAAVAHMGRTVDMRNYNLIYSDAVRDVESLDQLYERLNTQAHPEGYRGHSLSMSDVVICQGRKGCAAYYVDRYGFAPLPKFVMPPGGLPRASQRGKRAEKEGR